MTPRPASRHPKHLQQEIRYVEALLDAGRFSQHGMFRAGLASKASVQRTLRRLIRRLREQLPQD